jgi:hypothetical protein
MNTIRQPSICRCSETVQQILKPSAETFRGWMIRKTASRIAATAKFFEQVDLNLLNLDQPLPLVAE